MNLPKGGSCKRFRIKISEDLVYWSPKFIFNYLPNRLPIRRGYLVLKQALMTHGGFGYAKEYHVERYLRESLVGRIAPITPQLILCFIAEKVLGLPKSY